MSVALVVGKWGAIFMGPKGASILQHKSFLESQTAPDLSSLHTFVMLKLERWQRPTISVTYWNQPCDFPFMQPLASGGFELISQAVSSFCTQGHIPVTFCMHFDALRTNRCAWSKAQNSLQHQYFQKASLLSFGVVAHYPLRSPSHAPIPLSGCPAVQNNILVWRATKTISWGSK